MISAFFSKWGLIIGLSAALVATSAIGYLAWRLEATKADLATIRLENARLEAEAMNAEFLESVRSEFRIELREAVETIRSDMSDLNREIENDPDKTDSCWDTAVGRNIERLRSSINRD